MRWRRRRIKRIPNVTTVEALPDYVIRVSFDDGVVRDTWLGDMLSGPLFGPLKDPSFFAQAFVNDQDTVEWPDGLDLDPLILHGDFDFGSRSSTP